MKKLLSFLTLMILMSMVSLQSRAEIYLAADGYKFVKAELQHGKTYNQDNVQYWDHNDFCSLIHGGTITYDKWAKTLTLENVILWGSIWVVDEDLTIILKGVNTIKPSGITDQKPYQGIYMINSTKKTLTIQGENPNDISFTDSRLNINANVNIPDGQTSKGIEVLNGSLIIKGCKVTAKGTQGIYGSYPSDMTVDYAEVNAEGATALYSAIAGFKTLSLKSCTLDTPNGGKYEEVNGIEGVYSTVSGKKQKAQSVTINPIQPEIADNSTLKCCGNTIDLTKSGTYNSNITQGTIEYNAQTQTLTLDYVKYQGDQVGILAFNIPLKVQVTGTSKFECTGSRPIYIYNHDVQYTFIIEGNNITSDELYLTSDDYEAMHLHNSSATIKNCHVDAKGKFGIHGYVNGANSANVDLTIDNAYVKATGSTQTRSDGTTVYNGSICNLKSITLKDCGIFSPSKADIVQKNYDKSYAVQIVESDGNKHNVSDAVTIQQSYINIGKTNIMETGTYTSADLPGLESGTIKYDKDTKVLTLDNATISKGLNIYHVPANIRLIGENTINYSDVWRTFAITCNPSEPVTIYSNHSVDGVGKLKINTINGGTAIIGNSNAPLTIRTCELEVGNDDNTSKTGITNIGKLTIDRSTVKIKCNQYAMSSVSELELNGCSFTSPTDASLSYINGYNTLYAPDSNGTLCSVKEAIIEPDSYNVKVAGTTVNVLNKDNVLGDGMVSYNPTSHTLTIADGAIINAPRYITGSSTPPEEVIWANQNLNIALGGTVTLKQSANYRGAAAIKLEGNHLYNISSAESVTNPTLNILSTSVGIKANDNSLLAISECAVNVKEYNESTPGLIQGIAGSDNSTLEINGAEVNVCFGNATRNGLITRFNSVDLKYVSVSTPSGATYDTSRMMFAKDGTAVTGTIKIAPTKYDIVVAGTQVTGANCNDILGDGTVSYNPESNTLLLENAIIWPDNLNYEGIMVKQDLTIFVKGGNTVGSSGCAAIRVYQGKTLTIMGENSPELYTISTSTGSFGFGIFCETGSSLKVKSCYIKAIGVKGSLWGNNNTSLDLYASVISAYTMNGDAHPIYGFTNESLTDAKITYPAGGTWGNFEGKKFVLDASGEVVLTHVIIGQDKRESTIGILAELIEVLNGRKTGTYAYEYTGDGMIDLDDARYVIDDILETETTGTAIANIDGTPTEVQWVQLWTGGPKWAVMNVGAKKDSDYGKYFNFGENPKEPDYLWYGEDDDEFQGTDWDIAKNHWGDNWVMPRHDDYERMIGRCTFRWTNNYKSTGKSGYIVTGKDKYAGNSIFFPAAGEADHNNKVTNWNHNAYWTSTRVQDMVDGFALEFTSSKYDTNHFDLDIDQRFPVRAILSY